MRQPVKPNLFSTQLTFSESEMSINSQSQSANFTHQAKTARDPRLDFFRGIAMFIIFIAHMPWNPFTLWIPARYGFSDATEIFVFCSGMASAIAFAKVFDHYGMGIGTARVAHRVWQVYWSHILLFFVIAAMLATADSTGWFERNYVDGLNLRKFFNDPIELLPSLLTLTYVPNLFDILPMYLGILVLLPIVVWLSRFNPNYALIFVFLLWLVSQKFYHIFSFLPMIETNFPAEPWSDRKWFFNPFGWQLVFFTGFAFIRGWIPAPPVNRLLIALALAVIVVSFPFAYFRIRRLEPESELLMMAIEYIKFWREEYRVLYAKSDFGILRYIHFLAVAYLSWVAVGVGGEKLISDGYWGKTVKVIQKVGQQSLAVFVSSLVLARFMGILRDQIVARPQAPKDVNLVFILISFAILIGIAYLVAWFKSTPWKKPKKRHSTIEISENSGQKNTPAPA